MIRVDRPIVVEGKYDKIKLSSIIDGLIITTDGFAIFKNKEKLSLIKTLAEKSGIIIMTDSDSAGMIIRSYLKGAIPNDKITHVYIPEILGKEKRKRVYSSEGFLGVEGVDKDILINALERAGVVGSSIPTPIGNRPITKVDFMELGLTGGENSKALRQKLLQHLGFPTKMSANSLLDVLNELLSFKQLTEVLIEMGDSVWQDVPDKK